MDCEQCPGRFLGIISQDPIIQLHVDKKIEVIQPIDMPSELLKLPTLEFFVAATEKVWYGFLV